MQFEVDKEQLEFVESCVGEMFELMKKRTIESGLPLSVSAAVITGFYAKGLFHAGEIIEKNGKSMSQVAEILLTQYHVVITREVDRLEKRVDLKEINQRVSEASKIIERLNDRDS